MYVFCILTISRELHVFHLIVNTVRGLYTHSVLKHDKRMCQTEPPLRQVDKGNYRGVRVGLVSNLKL